MSTIYIVSDYGKLVKKGDVLQLKRENDVLKTIFPYKTEQLVIIGRIEITSQAFLQLMKHRIDTVFLSHNGKYNGKLVFETGKNVFLRQKQFKLLENEEFKLNFAKNITLGKLKNQLLFMQRIGRSGKGNSEIKDKIQQMKKTIRLATDANNLDSLRGYEGMGAKQFFHTYKYAITKDFAVFGGRSMNPPRDNVNAILSLIYTLIYYKIDAMLESEGFDSHIGYFHALNYGKKALSFDLMEEYRTPIADTLTAALFNLGVIKEDNFRVEEFSEDSVENPLKFEKDSSVLEVHEKEQRGVLLTKEGLKKVISQFEQKIDSQLYYQPREKKMSYREIMWAQVKHFKRVVNGEEKEYKPLVIK